ncbi:hypothetical protein [Acetatifactor aquisgranensis]|uniref:hypothetical protein n=1 Tax=Acetatifactor aquisgranensis TaxID=2941233 RepID=UPI00203E422A|nr:hypothetical protein [Acetatifactor aquisgranensis]MCI8542644.1 hypothetical protein [Lachnospiraceae bacterium]
MAGRLEESEEISMKGVSFITRHYNQILELLGKIIMNRALAMDMAKRKNKAMVKSGRRGNYFSGYIQPEYSRMDWDSEFLSDC